MSSYSEMLKAEKPTKQPFLIKILAIARLSRLSDNCLQTEPFPPVFEILCFDTEYLYVSSLIEVSENFILEVSYGEQ